MYTAIKEQRGEDPRDLYQSWRQHMADDADAAQEDDNAAEASPDAAASSGSADQDHVMAEREAERGRVLLDVQPAACSESWATGPQPQPQPEAPSASADGGSLPASSAVPTRIETDPRLTRARRRQALKPQRRRRKDKGVAK